MIEARNLVKDYGAIRAVDDVTFTVQPGDILGFLGPNGAGKSTTMKMVTGFLPPTAGTARIGGHDIREAPLEAKRLLGYLPENGPLYQEMTVREFLGFAAEMRGLRGDEAKRAIGRVSEICHLEKVRNQAIETLSKGFRQRVGMAQAVLHDPRYLIMDEPTDGLDPNQKREVRKLIASMAAEKAIVLSTHILEEVEEMCNRVIIIAQGRILVDETPAALRQRHPAYGAVHLQLAGTAPEDVGATLRTLPAVRRVEVDGRDFTVYPQTGENVTNAVLAAAREHGWSVERLEPARAPLDEVFAHITQGTRPG